MKRFWVVLTLLAGLGCADAALDGNAPTPTPGDLEAVDLLVAPPGGPPQIAHVTAADTLSTVDVDLVDPITITGVLYTVGNPPAPLAEGAQITARGVGPIRQRIEVITNAEPTTGLYELIIAPGEYELIVTPNAAVTTQPIFKFTVPFSESGEFDITLPTPFFVTGTIRDDQGQPVGSGFRVTALEAASIGQAQAALTDANGVYELALPAPGTYTLRITPPVQKPEFPQVDIAAVEVSADLAFDYDFPTGFPATLVNVTGTITPADLSPPPPNFADMRVTASGALDPIPSRPTETFTYVASADVTAGGGGGDFSVPVLPNGSYTLTLLPTVVDPFSHRAVANVDVADVDVAVDSASTVLSRKLPLFGQVRDNQGRVVENALVFLTATDTSGFLFADNTDSSGLYQLDVNHAPYDVLALPPATSGFVRVNEQIVIDAATEPPLDLIVERGQLLDGVVRDAGGTAIESVQITVLGPDGARIGSDQASTSGNGSFTVTIPALVNPNL